MASYCVYSLATVGLFFSRVSLPPFHMKGEGVQAFLEGGYPFHTDAGYGGSCFPLYLIRIEISRYYLDKIDSKHLKTAAFKFFFSIFFCTKGCGFGHDRNL